MYDVARESWVPVIDGINDMVREIVVVTCIEKGELAYVTHLSLSFLNLALNPYITHLCYASLVSCLLFLEHVAHTFLIRPLCSASLLMSILTCFVLLALVLSHPTLKSRAS